MKKRIVVILIISIFAVMLFPLGVNADIDTSQFESVRKIDNSDHPINRFAGDAYFAIRVFCTGLAVVTCIVQGIRYMTTSVENKAQIKQQLVPLLVGIAALFLVTTIAVTVANIAVDITE